MTMVLEMRDTDGDKKNVPENKKENEKNPGCLARRILRAPHRLLPPVQRHHLKHLRFD